MVEVPFRYLHKAPASGYEVKDFNIQTSGYESLGLKIDFFIDCHGQAGFSQICKFYLALISMTIPEGIASPPLDSSVRECLFFEK